MLRVLSIAACAALLMAPAVLAANLALVLTRAQEGDGLGFMHGEIVATYEEAGFAVSGGLDLDRAGVLAAIAEIEDALEKADHLVVHLSGGLTAAGGLALFAPADVRGEGVAELLAGAVPLPLLLALPEARPGAGVLAVGRAGNAALPLPDSNTVLILDGPAGAVADLIATRLLADGLPPSQIDGAASGVRLSGLVSDSFVLGRAGSVAASAATPESTENALALSLDERAALQDGLALLGFDPTETGGSFGPGTRAALAGWAEASGHSAIGYLTAATLAALQADISAARDAAARDAAEREGWAAANRTDTLEGYRAFLGSFPDSRFASLARDRLATLEKSAAAAERVAGYRELEQGLGLTLASVATIEKRLSALGFTPGPADGRVEIPTRRSIAQFQAQVGLTPTGYLNPATLQKLLTITP